MKVLQVIPAVARRYGGPSEAVVSLTRGLLNLGIDVAVASTDADGDGRLAVPCSDITSWRGIPIRFFPRRFGEAYKYSPAMAKWLTRRVCDFDLVHIHAVFSHSSVSAADACRRQGVPYVLRPLGSLDPATYARHPIRKRLFYHIWGDRLLEDAAAIQYATEREMHHVERTFAPGRGFVAHPGIGVYDDAEDAHAGAARGHDLEFPSPYVLYLGRIHPIKRLETLVDAFFDATSDSALSHWHLVIAGDGEIRYATRLRSRARQRHREDRIHFPGWLKGREKSSALNAAELFALTSMHENFGTAVAEAMLAGLPAVVSSEVFLSDLIRRHGAGWVVAGGVRAVASGLRGAMLSAEHRAERGQKAKQLASREFGIEQTSRVVLEKYNEIITGHHRARGN